MNKRLVQVEPAGFRDLSDPSWFLASDAYGFAVGDILLLKERPAGNLVTSRFAAAGSALQQVVTTLIHRGLNPLHPVASIHEAEAFRNVAPAPWHDKSLVDLTRLPFVTIDNEDSRDLDQALYLEALDDGFRLYYALADASWFVRPGTDLFAEALNRGTTYYAPSIAATMLPPLLSEDLVSLNPAVRRRALVFRMNLDRHGDLINSKVLRAAMISHAKLSYRQVQQFYDHEHSDTPTPHPWHHEPWADSLRVLNIVGQLRILLARARNVIDYDRQEPEVIIDPVDPCRFSIRIRERYDSERYNEQLSLLCNTAGAQLLDKLGRYNPTLHAIFRIHLPPLSARLTRFRQQLEALIHQQGLDSRWHWQPGQSLSDYVDSLPADESGRRLRLSIERMIMLTNRASTYSDESEPHHALAVEAYARFSSPMREMVGIFTHKELLEGLELEPAGPPEIDERLRDQIIESGNHARREQRQLEKIFQKMALDSFLAEDLALPVDERRLFHATIMGMKPRYIYLQLDDFALDIKLYLDELEVRYDCRYQVSLVAARADVPDAPHFIIGNEVKIRTLSTDDQHRYLFEILSI